MSRRIVLALATVLAAFALAGLCTPDGAAASNQPAAQAEVWNVEAVHAIVLIRSDADQRWVAHVVPAGTSEVWRLGPAGEVLIRFQGTPPDVPPYVIRPGRWVLYRDAVTGTWGVGQRPEHASVR